MSSPRFSKEAKSRVARLRNEYAEAVEGIARHLASVEGFETVQESHVNRAHELLYRPHDSQRPFWQRRDVLSTAGTFLAGVGGTVFGVAFGHYVRDGQIVAGNAAAFWWLVVAVPTLLFVVGVSLAVAGWVRRD